MPVKLERPDAQMILKARKRTSKNSMDPSVNIPPPPRTRDAVVQCWPERIIRAGEVRKNIRKRKSVTK